MISIEMTDKTSGTYRIEADDIPVLHQSGEWWIEKGTIYLDQTHRYQDDLFKAIEEKAGLIRLAGGEE